MKEKTLKYFSSRLTQEQRNFDNPRAKLEERFRKRNTPHVVRRQSKTSKKTLKNT
jgi:hypothetical protein